VSETPLAARRFIHEYFADEDRDLYYELDSDGFSVIVTSPDHAAAGMDLESTHVLVAPPGLVPEAQTMTCTVSELHPGGEVFELEFLIQPATH
jgi:hypothetical protein